MSEWTRRLEHWIRCACIAEVTSAKPGNVSPDQSFDDVCANYFVSSANVIAPIISKVASSGDSNTGNIGFTILEAVKATLAAVDSNTNLGIVLLLTPLASVPQMQSLNIGIEPVLSGLTVNDAFLAYQAISLASPGGLGSAESEDVATSPTLNLRACMQLAADRDLIAAQYSNGFQQVLGTGLSLLQQTQKWSSHHEWRLAWVALNLIAEFGDSLILRKCGDALFRQTSQQATEVIQAGWPFAAASHSIYLDFDKFLRSDANKRNPGTTADMIAAIMFAAFRERLCVCTDAPQLWAFAE